MGTVVLVGKYITIFRQAYPFDADDPLVSLVSSSKSLREGLKIYYATLTNMYVYKTCKHMSGLPSPSPSGPLKFSKPSLNH